MWFPPVASTWIPRDIHQFCLLGIVPSWYMCHFCSIFLSMSEMWWSMYCELLCSRHFTHRHAKNKPHLKSVVFLYVEIQMHTEGNKIISYSMHQWFISPGSLKTDNAHPYLSLHISHPSQLCLCKWTQSKRYDRKIMSWLFDSVYWHVFVSSTDWKRFLTWNSCEHLSGVLSTIWHN